MLETRELRIRVRPDQYAQIQARAQLKGFNTVSSYVRDSLLRVPPRMEKMLIEIYEKLIQTKP